MVTRDLVPAAATPRPEPSELLRRGARTIGATAWRHPWWGAVVAGVIGWALNAPRPLPTPTDYDVFVAAGDAVLHGHLADAFASPTVQAGPLTLVGLAGLDHLASSVGLQALLASLCMALLASCCLTVAVRFRQHPPRTALAGGGLVLAWTLAALWGPLTGNWAHPTHALVPLLWLVTAREAQAGRGARAGAALGLALALDPWAVFGACALLLLLPDKRALARALATSATVTVVVWGPFLVAGAATGRMTWTSLPGTVPHLLGLTDIGAGYRVAQAVLVLAVGSALVVRQRHNPDLAWLLPPVLVATRILTDGIYLDYYSFPVRVGLLVGVAILVARADRRAVPLALAAWLTSVQVVGATYLVSELPLVCGVVLAVVVVCRRDADPGQPTSRPIAARASE